jgi:hypothetical protein
MRFSIRDLLWLTVVVALGVGWWADRRQLATKASASEQWEFRANLLAEMLRQDGGQVFWTDDTITGTGAKSGTAWSAKGP